MASDLNSPPDQSLLTHFRNPFLNLPDIGYDVAYMWELNKYMVHNEENHFKENYCEKKIEMRKQLAKKLKDAQLGFIYNEIDPFIEKLEGYDKTQILKIIKTGGGKDGGLELITVKVNKNNLGDNICKTLLQYPIRFNFRNYKSLKSRNIIQLFFFITFKTNKPTNQYKTPIYQLIIYNDQIIGITEIISTGFSKKSQDNEIRIETKMKPKWKTPLGWNLVVLVLGSFFFINIMFLFWTIWKKIHKNHKFNISYL